MTEIKSLTIEELKAALADMGEKPFRAGQIFKWLHGGVESFEEMSNLSKDLRQRLAERFILTAPTVARKQVSKVDGTVKYLWRRRDGDCVESVLMHYEHGVSVCVSTQVGCRMGCKFCASGLNGKKRDLSAGEILDEILFMQKDSGEKISSIVLMGTGEPLDNYDNVLKFLHLVSCPEGINIGQRHISLSTSGIADKIEALAEEKLQITLSISLHAPDNETRSSIMPVNDAYPVERLMRACRYYFDTTGRRISYEYMMARDKTDRPWQAEQLTKLLRGRPAHVNLIPLNEVAEDPLRALAAGDRAPLPADAGKARRDRDRAAQARPGYRRGLRPAPSAAAAGGYRRGGMNSGRDAVQPVKKIQRTALPAAFPGLWLAGGREPSKHTEVFFMEWFGLTDKGRVRPTNQDIYQIEAREANQTALLVVCDGMGGANAGNVASRFAAQVFTESIKAELTGALDAKTRQELLRARWTRRTTPCSALRGGSPSSAAWAPRWSRRSCRAARRPSSTWATAVRTCSTAPACTS